MEAGARGEAVAGMDKEALMEEAQGGSACVAGAFHGKDYDPPNPEEVHRSAYAGVAGMAVRTWTEAVPGTLAETACFDDMIYTCLNDDR